MKALITGITGQDGSYLAEFLLEKGYEVHGIVRRSSSFNTGRIDQLYDYESSSNTRITLHYADLADSSSIFNCIKKICPDEIYNLGAQSHVGISFEIPEFTGEVTGLALVRILEAIRYINPKIKLYQASSSELFGKVAEIPQSELTPFYPRSPYGCAKLFAFWTVKNYRESYGIFAVNGILFNHESPRRGRNFVTRKVVGALCRLKMNSSEKILELGNLDAKRDWGYAKDYVEAMWLMLQQETPEDYVIATGETHSVREFVEETARMLGFEIYWSGEGLEEVGIDAKSGKTLIKINERFFRPAEVELLMGDSSKAKNELGWVPKTGFKELVSLMVSEELKIIKNKSNNY